MDITPYLPPDMLLQPELPVPATAPQRRRMILDLQHEMELARDNGTMVAVEFPVEHTFTEGNYARQMTIPAGGLVVGKIHKHAHLNFVMRGRCRVYTSDGPMEIQAPLMFVSKPGTKRVVMAYEETVWVTVHPTNETDPAVIEEQIIAKDFSEIGAEVDGLQKLEGSAS